VGFGLYCPNKRRQGWSVLSFSLSILSLSNGTSDLADGGAHHFAETIRKIKQK